MRYTATRRAISERSCARSTASTRTRGNPDTKYNTSSGNSVGSSWKANPKRGAPNTLAEPSWLRSGYGAEFTSANWPRRFRPACWPNGSVAPGNEAAAAGYVRIPIDAKIFTPDPGPDAKTSQRDHWNNSDYKTSDKAKRFIDTITQPESYWWAGGE